MGYSFSTNGLPTPTMAATIPVSGMDLHSTEVGRLYGIGSSLPDDKHDANQPNSLGLPQIQRNPLA
jgi:hypothetical protein